MSCPCSNTTSLLKQSYLAFLQTSSKSLLKKYLQPKLFNELVCKKTPFNSTLLDCIQSGLNNPDSNIGVYAPDSDSYTVFAGLFNPIIEDYHGFRASDKHPPTNWEDVNGSTFVDLDPERKYIRSTRIRCARSIQNYPFNPKLEINQYREIESLVVGTLDALEGELSGKFYSLETMTKEDQTRLIDDHFLFKEGDRFLQDANACRFWPVGRGIFHNDAKTFLVWCNEEDHLRIISMENGGDLKSVYRRLVTAVKAIELKISFARDDRLGYLTFCPTNLGTTIRASVHINLPKLASDEEKLHEIAGRFNLQVRGTRGEHSEAEQGIFDVSNKRRLGLSEFDAVKEMQDGILELIKMEEAA